MTVLDDFNDGDLTEYSNVNAAFQTQQSIVHEGTHSLQKVSGEANSTGIWRNDVTVSQGDVVQAWLRWDSASFDFYNIDMRFAVTSDGSGYYRCYIAPQGQFSLIVDDGSGETTLAEASPSVSKQAWYRINIDWAADGSMTATLYDDQGVQASQISATDTTHTSGGIGWGAGNSSIEAYYDLYEKNPGGGAPAAPSGLNATVQ